MGTSRAKFLIDRIANSKLYRDYERAFSETTHMPVCFRPVEFWQPAQRGKKYENPFCALVTKTNQSCGMCLEAQQKISRPEARVQTGVCFAGLTDSTVPVTLGEQVLGFLQTGQVLLKKPTTPAFNQLLQRLIERGANIDFKKLREAYFHLPTLRPGEYRTMVRLLEIFGRHLSLIVSQLDAQMENRESPAIRKAKKFIQEHQGENISMRDAAKIVNMSTFYFCKMFKKMTGLNFTEYLSQIRIMKAKNLLSNPESRICDIAYETGYQSQTHFNRMFRRIAGQSPTAYRKSLPSVTV